MNKALLIALLGITGSLTLVSCSKSRGNNTGIEYAPDMYYAKGYEPFQEKDSNKFNKFGSNMREPVKGTVAIGKLDYHYDLDNNGEGYEASASRNFPSDFTFDFAKGKRLYGIYCAVCHGAEGKNDGSVFQRVSAIKPPWSGYQDEYIKALSAGKIFHVVTYGKNNMGSHASVLTPSERWQVVAYVKELSGSSVNTSTPSTQTVSDSTNLETN